MPELVTCPSCGCRVQVAEMFLGQRTRCIACSHLFVAAPDLGPPARDPGEDAPDIPYPLEPLPPEAPRLSPMPGFPRHCLPLCPQCHRSVSWEAMDCPYCGHLFDPRFHSGPGEWVPRRDALPHRAQLIDNLGTFSMLGGALSLCTGPLGMVSALATGLPALVMAQHDLDKMRIGAIDPLGRTSTEFGRNKAMIGVLLSLVFFVLFFFLFIVDRFR